MELYHIHRLNCFDKSFYEGAELNVGETPNLYRLGSLRRVAAYLNEITYNDKGEELYSYNPLYKGYDIEVINKMSEEKKKDLIKH